ncbi:MAG: heavy-metal-associated domain-containing protein [Bacteroidaceae bacterium]|nr:heavy-metal-associated domain-containing protein [Bacteroidaceae bacterium]
MKKIVVLMVAALMVCATTVAKELKVLVVKTTPAVQNVEAQTKVKDLLRLTAGVKKVVADFSAQQVSVTYDADKTTAKKILASLKKNGYEATVVSDGASKENAKGQGAGDGVSGASPQKM